MKVEKKNETELLLKQSFFSFYVIGAILIGIGIFVLFTSLTSAGSEDNLNNTLIVTGLGLFSLVAGFFIFLKGGKRYLSFNKSAGELSIDTQTIRNKSKETYSIEKLSKLVINNTMETTNSGKNNSARMDQVQYFSLQFSDGNTVDLGKIKKGTLGQVKSAISGSSLPPYIQEIVDFTGVEVEHVNHSVLGGLMNKMGR